MRTHAGGISEFVHYFVKTARIQEYARPVGFSVDKSPRVGMERLSNVR